MASLGVNLRVTAACNQGGRKYMEDTTSTKYINSDEGELLFAFFGIYDGHGGMEASQYAKEHLLNTIMSQKGFYSNDDEVVLKAIREGFLATQQAMWKALPTWKKTASGLPSTAGTTASVCFVKRGKLFVGHVGDSGIVLGERDPHHPVRWRAKPLTRDHKPDCEIELARIHKAGGKVIAKSGVPRVVWYRPTAHQGPVRRSTHIEEVPFLAVARSLGDLWSYNSKEDVFVVSPDPDVHVFDLDVIKDRCLVMASDGLWNVVSPAMAVQSVFDTDRHNEPCMIDPHAGHPWLNPSKRLVDLALNRWSLFNLRADNVSVITIMLDPPGPVRGQVLRQLYGKDLNCANILDPTVAALQRACSQDLTDPDSMPKGNSLISRMPDSRNENDRLGLNLLCKNKEAIANDIIRIPKDLISSKEVGPDGDAKLKIPEEPTSTVDTDATMTALQKPVPVTSSSDKKIQCSEVSSSDNECDSPAPPPLPSRPPGGHRGRKSIIPTEAMAGPTTRTRQQIGQLEPVVSTPTPPLPVKQIRRSIVPGYSGYNSDSENQPGQANDAGTTERRNLRSSLAPTTATKTPKLTAQKKESSVLTPSMAVNSKKAVKRPESGPQPAAAAPMNKTSNVSSTPARKPNDEISTVIQARVLRSRNTPQQPAKCVQRTISALPVVAQKPTLPETGVKRKRRSFEPSGVSALANKMLKLSQDRSTWLNAVGRRSTSNLPSSKQLK